VRIIVWLAIVALWACGGAPASDGPDADRADGDTIDGGPIDTGPVRLRGGVQKGPFILGSSLAISAIDGFGNPTGVVFNATTFNDLGEFAIDFSYLGAVSLEANGFYYNEATGGLSGAPLTLRAFHEITSGGVQAAYVNLVTHLTYGRVRNLVGNGTPLAAATAQAEGELRAELHVGPVDFAPEAPGIYLNELGGDNDSNAYLLAVSAVLTKAGLASGADAGLQELVNTISVDLASDGRLEDALKAGLDATQRTVDGDAVMTLFRARLADIGSDLVVPNIHRMLDTDGDRFPNLTDNCPLVWNPGQEDGNGNTRGDACETEPLEATASLGSRTDAVGVTWLDLDNDGDLDLATAQNLLGAVVYRNEGGVLATTPMWTSTDGPALAVAWADMDGDGDPDLAVAGGQLRVYRNDGGHLSATAIWTSDGTSVNGVAWGDADGDGDLDVAASEAGVGYRWYRVAGGVPTMPAAWSSAPDPGFGSLEWGDVDRDGDADLVTGGIHAQMYRNESHTLTASPTWVAGESAPAGSGWYVALTDMDWDGDLDLATSSYVYRNDRGTLALAPAWTSPAPTGSGRSVAWGDADGNGFPDLAVGGDPSSGGASQYPTLYLSELGRLLSSSSWNPTDSIGKAVAWGDVDGDFDLDLAAGAFIYVNTTR
jgi:hypothetical protein